MGGKKKPYTRQLSRISKASRIFGTTGRKNSAQRTAGSGYPLSVSDDLSTLERPDATAREQ